MGYFPSQVVAVRRALVVDDDPDINQLVRVRLTRRGYEVGEAANGEDALARIAASAPDLVFLDVSMPGMSGLDVLQELREQKLDLAVIMMTAFGSEEVAVEALRRGADDYLRKPFESREFFAVLERTVVRLELTRQNAWLRRQLDEELARAAKVQADLLPHAVPALPGIQLAARCVPAREVGGDFYDWLEPTPGSLNLTLADVMGKGMPAALLMATTRAVLRAVSQDHAPAEAVTLAAHAAYSDLDRSGSFVTLFHAHINVAERLIEYVDAGHGHVFVRHADGTIEHLKAGGLPFGIFPDQAYEAGCLQLGRGDALVLYSDGLVDERLPEAIELTTIISAIEGLNDAEDIAERLINLVGCSGNCPDDLTVIVLLERE